MDSCWRMVGYRGDYALYRDDDSWYVVDHRANVVVTTVPCSQRPPAMVLSYGNAAAVAAREWHGKPVRPTRATHGGAAQPSGVENPGDCAAPPPEVEHVGR